MQEHWITCAAIDAATFCASVMDDFPELGVRMTAALNEPCMIDRSVPNEDVIAFCSKIGTKKGMQVIRFADAFAEQARGNIGMFDKLRRYVPEIAQPMRGMVVDVYKNADAAALHELFDVRQVRRPVLA